MAAEDAHDSRYQAALAIARRLRKAGYQAFFAGGCVRDLLLGVAPRDYDVATSARPEQVVGLFAGVRGYLDAIEVGKIGAFERQLLTEMRAREPGILESIRTDRELKPETEKKLIAFLDGFAKAFA